jgi:hypothetical protein
MSAGRHSFKLNDAARLVAATIRATPAAGLKVKAVTMRDGKPYVEIDDGAAKADDGKNPWDKVPNEDAERPA